MTYNSYSNSAIYIVAKLFIRNTAANFIYKQKKIDINSEHLTEIIKIIKSINGKTVTVPEYKNILTLLFSSHYWFTLSYL